MASATPGPALAPPSPSLPVSRLVGVGLIIFFANAALLVLQLVASRLLAPFIGSSLETWTSIIGVFLVGIALGNAYGGRVADRYPSPRTLGLVLAGGAAAALWMVFFPTLLSSTIAYRSVPLGPRIPLLALFLCLPAGFVLSLLTPLAIKLGLPDVSRTGRVAGMVFALSTLGCLIGNYVTGFVLIPTFTINTLVFLSAGALAALAAGTFVMMPAPSTLVAQSNPPAPFPPGEGEEEWLVNPYAFRDIRLAYTIVFLASFGGMTLELTASRVLAQYLGVSLFTWTGIIGVMLAGTALGNFTGGLFADRASQSGGMRRPMAWLYAIAMFFLVFGLIDKVLPWACTSLGSQFLLSGRRLATLATVLALAVAYGTFQIVVRVVGEYVNPRSMLAATLLAAGAGTVLLLVVRTVLTRSAPFDHFDPIVQVMGWTFSLFFLPMFALGMVSPQVIRLAVPDLAHVGRVAGRVYAWSTGGAIVGTFAAGYVLLSTAGADRTLLGVSLLLILTSLLVAKVWDNNTMLYVFSIVLGSVTGGFILTWYGEFDPRVIAKLETNYYTIKVTEERDRYDRPTGVRILYLDALIHSEVNPDDPTYLHYIHEHIQVEFLWAAAAQTKDPRVLVIGGGGYTFQRYAMEKVPQTLMDVVEIDPGVTKVAFEHLGLKHYPRLNIVHMDGRQYVAEKAVPETYDLVVQDAVNDLSVPSHLLTKEYNDALKRTLRPDGTYLLTVIDSLKYGRLWRSSMRTLRESFAHVELISSGPFPAETMPAGLDDEQKRAWKKEFRQFTDSRQVLVILASDQPLDVDRLRAEAYRRMDFLPRAAHGALGGLVEGPIIAAVGAMAQGLSYTAFFTHPIPAGRLAPYLATDPGVLLTDQFAPVDNLMAEVFRYRYRERPPEEPDR